MLIMMHGNVGQIMPFSLTQIFYCEMCYTHIVLVGILYNTFTGRNSGRNITNTSLLEASQRHCDSKRINQNISRNIF